MIKILVLCLSLFFITNCEKKYNMQQITWSPQSEISFADSFNDQDFQKDLAPIKIKNEFIERSHQFLGKAVVEESFLQTIRSSDGKIKYFKSNRSTHPTDFLLKKIDRLYEKKDKALEKIKLLRPEIGKSTLISDVKLVFSNNKNKPNLFYQIEWLAENHEKAYLTQFLSKKIIHEEQIGNYFQSEAIAYPRGPRLSNLEKLKIDDLNLDGSLNSKNLSLITKSSDTAISKNHIFDYKIDDPRFDQVQAFVFANATIAQFKKRLGVSLPYQLKVFTHVGFPEKKSAMFYFNQTVNLGQGDEINYKNILKDPTIVMHEVAHAYVELISGQKQGVINEAFADFFTSSFLNHPKLGEVSYIAAPFTRNLENKTTYTELSGKTYADSLIISGTLWDIRSELGAAKTEDIAVKTLARLGPNGQINEVGKIIFEIVSAQLSAIEKNKVINCLKNREWIF